MISITMHIVGLIHMQVRPWASTPFKRYSKCSIKKPSGEGFQPMLGEIIPQVNFQLIILNAIPKVIEP